MNCLTLIIPMTPTPDAPLHLGHMSGPYLSADLLARIYRVLEKPYIFISAIDAYENWCEKKSIAELHQIFLRHQRAFELLNIKFDNFYNPLEGDFKETYRKTLRASFEAFSKFPGFQERKEFIKFDQATKFWGIGSHISGQCPNCNNYVRGNVCIYCYFYLQPEDLVNFPIHQEKGQYVKVKNYFFQIEDSCLADLTKTQIPAQGWALFNSWLSKKHSAIRLTYPGAYGITISIMDPRIIRNTFFQFCLALIQETQNKIGTKFSKIELQLFMGFDNFIANGAGACILASTVENILIKRIELNHMLYYMGSKFSKSKQHGPTVQEALEGCHWIERSAMRVFLMLLNLEHSNNNFNPEEFMKFYIFYKNSIEIIIESCSSFILNIDKIKNTNCYARFLNALDGSLNRSNLAEMYIYLLKQLAESPTQGIKQEFLLACQVVDPQLYNYLIRND